MNVACKKCRTKINIPDHKIPRDRMASFKCPKCKGKIDLQPEAESSNMDPADSQGGSAEKHQVFDEINTALICVDDPGVKKQVHAVLSLMDYQAIMVKNCKSALSKMQYHTFNIIVLSDDFERTAGFNTMLYNMNRMDMTQRRRTCLVLISRAFKTNDAMKAAHLSVNQIVSAKDMAEFEQHILRAATEHQNVYAVFNDCLSASRPY
ncbi:MAG: hypothetical protein D3926_08990 [Desulfobacteraceae bacterium]|nr:MAG: hypothetical protein D3926_08990 [Desulfobacteraceae bacterium]